MCLSQGVLEILAVLFRQKLAGNQTLKSVWIGASVVLSLAMLSLSVEYLNETRQLILFLFCLGQIVSLVVLVVTLVQIRDLVREKLQRQQEERKAEMVKQVL